MNFRHVLLLCSTSCILHASAQTILSVDSPFVFGSTHTFHSRLLGQDRTLNVYLPVGYADSSLNYPVIYVLDGSKNEDFPHIAGLMQFMNMYDLLPRSIVVGIANDGASRYHDFTSPTRSDSDLVRLPTGGGSAAFIAFIGKEAQPFVEQRYRISGRRTIIGQSLGGLLGVEILFTQPELFDDYILVSPSLWWNDGAFAAGADEWVRTHATLPKRVYIAAARDDTMMQQEIDQVVAALRDHSEPPLEWWFVPFPEETHATILHRAVYKAFELFNAEER